MTGRLASLVDEHGEAFATDPERVRGSLRTALGDAEPEVSLLVAGAETGVTAELIAARGSATPDLLRHLTKELVDERGLSPRGARWVVDTWAWALGVEEAAAPVLPADDPPVVPDADGFTLSARPPFRLADHSFSLALAAFVVATIVTMVVLSKAGPDATGVTAVPRSLPQAESSANVTISVPSLLTLTRSQAVERLRALGLEHQITTRSSTKARRGTVLRQDPAPGSSLRDGAQVTLVIAVPPTRVGTPTGLSFERTATSVTITWDPPRDGSGVDHYEIWRSGELVGTRAAGHRTFTDAGLASGSTHLYGVKAIGFNGTEARSRTRTITLPAPVVAASPSPSSAPVTGPAPPPPPAPPSPSQPPTPCPAPDPDFCD